jgi:hypothetical protein
MTKVRIEELAVGEHDEFTKNLWIESKNPLGVIPYNKSKIESITLNFGDIIFYENKSWIVVETV